MFPGLKCSAFLAVISLWGVMFMLVLGALFKNESVGLLEDLPEHEMPANATLADRRAAIRQSYAGNAVNCFGAAALYAVVFLLSSVNLFRLARSNGATASEATASAADMRM